MSEGEERVWYPTCSFLAACRGGSRGEEISRGGKKRRERAATGGGGKGISRRKERPPRLSILSSLSSRRTYRRKGERVCIPRCNRFSVERKREDEGKGIRQLLGACRCGKKGGRDREEEKGKGNRHAGLQT